MTFSIYMVNDQQGGRAILQVEIGIVGEVWRYLGIAQYLPDAGIT
jgi:hypothetical protein